MLVPLFHNLVIELRKLVILPDTFQSQIKNVEFSRLCVDKLPVLCDTMHIPGQPGKSSHFTGAHIMPTKQYPTDVLIQAKVVLDSWNQLGDLSFGNLNAAALNKDLDQAKQIDAQMVNLENQLTNLRNQRISTNQAIWDKLKRVRAGVKATYGDDSSEYEMVGGTPLSERKTATRKAPTPA